MSCPPVRLRLAAAFAALTSPVFAADPPAGGDRAQSRGPERTKLPERRRRPDVIFVPTPQDVVEKMLELAGVTKGDMVADLGCGDGRIVVTAAKKYGCKAVGYDLDEECVRLSLESVKKAGVERLVHIA